MAIPSSLDAFGDEVRLLLAWSDRGKEVKTSITSLVYMSAVVERSDTCLHTRTCRDRSSPALPSLDGLTRDLVGGIAFDAGQLLRIVSGKDHRTVDEMSRGSKRARETSQYWWYQGAGELPQLLDPVGRGQDKKNKLPWNAVARC